MAKKIKVKTIQQNQLLEIPSDNIEIEAKSNEAPLIIGDTTENQILPLDNIETVEPLDVKQDLAETIIKVKKQRVKKKK